jgi:hypothetical protein
MKRLLVAACVFAAGCAGSREKVEAPKVWSPMEPLDPPPPDGMPELVIKPRRDPPKKKEVAPSMTMPKSAPVPEVR